MNKSGFGLQNAPRKINVVGTSGSGKSTMSRAISDVLDIPYIEMDKLYWKPNWEEPGDDEFFASLRLALDCEQWVLDGNYTRTIPIKWSDIDLVVWVDFPFVRTLNQAIIRALKRVISAKELWPGTGNRETWRLLFSKDSIVWWTIKTYKHNRVRMLELMNSKDNAHITFIRLTSPSECKSFIKHLSQLAANLS